MRSWWRGKQDEASMRVQVGAEHDKVIITQCIDVTRDLILYTSQPIIQLYTHCIRLSL